MKLDTALHQLKHRPLDFLGNNLLSISGRAQSGACPYYFGYYDNLGPGVNEGFKFQPGFPPPSTKTGIDGKRYTVKMVHSVRMNPSSEDLDVSAMDGYVLDATGPDIMVTGQLSACVFAIRREAGRLLVAHIQPGGRRQSGSMLRQTIKLMGRFSGNGDRVTQTDGPLQ